MEKNEISIHEIRVFAVLSGAKDTWMTSKEIAKLAAPISDRTVRAHTLKLVQLGLLDQAEVFPAHRYRLSPKMDKRNGSYLRRITAAADVFGVKLERGR